jgi:hypothetical protein
MMAVDMALEITSCLKRPLTGIALKYTFTGVNQRVTFIWTSCKYKKDGVQRND